MRGGRQGTADGPSRPRQVGLARRRIEALWAATDRVELTDELACRAGDLAERHGLRAHDAVHLASFEEVGDPETVLVSGDEELLGAARSLGFATIRPPD
ncbi:MAG TPA: type II toxin-antitoxin system VapC family toxin [Gaiellaceae bacterium]|nr:type II toxin-antitoxin system VapC family toxin [Gaiellaceae bacterium]